MCGCSTKSIRVPNGAKFRVEYQDAMGFWTKSAVQKAGTASTVRAVVREHVKSRSSSLPYRLVSVATGKQVGGIINPRKAA